ncbi:hypothetical protein BS47DRAFT_1382187 [Hydnum rufescens UP504]|uniref:HNH nuclease domain-containing protein n=1 Tax=Hydnum rufescens UP504 TaxID=1448309 RepID=A0A9P6DT65_9AGAM|nr:hypothetical protein BS47DRAFT_1382187 [Hydnum rufescens UP504]
MYMPSTVPSGAAKLAGEIVDCEDAAALDALASLIIEGFLRVFKGKRMGRTPAHSDHLSRPSFDRDWANNLTELREVPVDHADTKRKALVRDNYRCMLTGKVDVNSWKTGLVEIEDAPTLATAHEKLLKVPNKYRVGAFPERLLTLFDLLCEVIFTSSDPLLPLPNPRYLEMHTTATKVAHLSGAAEYIEKTLRDLEEVKVLVADGSSAELLKSALQISVH